MQIFFGILLKKPLLCIGVNPSTATPEKTDKTIESVERIINNNGYDSWIMINLYPQRRTNINELPNKCDDKIVVQNLDTIKLIIEQFGINEIWAAWGTLINKRDYLFNCFMEIYEITSLSKCKWITFGNCTKDGHPHHPLYLSANSEKKDFDIEAYISKFVK